MRCWQPLVQRFPTFNVTCMQKRKYFICNDWPGMTCLHPWIARLRSGALLRLLTLSPNTLARTRRVWLILLHVHSVSSGLTQSHVLANVMVLIAKLYGAMSHGYLPTLNHPSMVSAH